MTEDLACSQDVGFFCDKASKMLPSDSVYLIASSDANLAFSPPKLSTFFGFYREPPQARAGMLCGWPMGTQIGSIATKVSNTAFNYNNTAVQYFLFAYYHFMSRVSSS